MGSSAWPGTTGSSQWPSSASPAASVRRSPGSAASGRAVRRILTVPRAGSSQASRTRPSRSCAIRGIARAATGGCGRAATGTPRAAIERAVGHPVESEDRVVVDPVVLQAVVVGFFAKRLDPVAVPGAARSRATLADDPYVDRRRGERPRQIDRPAADRDADVLDLAEQGDRPDGHGARRGDPAPLAQDGVADRLGQARRRYPPVAGSLTVAIRVPSAGCASGPPGLRKTT